MEQTKETLLDTLYGASIGKGMLSYQESAGGIIMGGCLAGDHQTSCATVLDINAVEKLIESKEFEDIQSPEFHKIKNLVGFLVVRSKLKNYLKNVNGMLENFNELALRENLTSLQPNKRLTERGVQIMQKYTAGKNWYCTRVNLLLALDLIKDENASYAKQLKACIGWQTPKYSGKVYRGALLSVCEIFVMAYKKTFYIPSFTSAAICPEKMIFNVYPDNPESCTGYQNVILEIDTSEFPNFSTIIQCNQTEFDETECLMSCYNIYSWKGLRVIKYKCKNTGKIENIPVISLKLENYNLIHDLDTQTVKGDHNQLDPSVISKKGLMVQNRSVRPATLLCNLAALIESYNRKYEDTYPLTWLNANFTPIEETLQIYGRSINGIEFQKLMDIQNAQLQQTTTITTTTTQTK